jgi:uridine monophosphate synthetase
MEASRLESLLLKIHDVGAVKFGQYKLKTGLLSPIYIDIRSIVSYPEILNLLCDLMWEKLTTHEDKLLDKTDFLAGVPYTALPIASVMAVTHDLPMLIVRKERKAYGTGKEVEGVYRAGQTCLVIEDVVTSGASILETRDRIQHEGLVVNTAIVFIDRDQGGVEHLAKSGVTLLKVTCMTELVDVLHKFGRIDANIRQSVLTFVAENKQVPVAPVAQVASSSSNASEKTEDEIAKYSTLTFSARAGLAKSAFAAHVFKLMDSKKTNLCVAVDVKTKAELLDLAEKLGPEICMLKTHIDIVEDFDQDLVTKLSDLASKHKFILFEDRKFADIGNTVKAQYTGGIYKISSWAHLTNTHIVAGPASVGALAEAALSHASSHPSSGPRGLLLLAQMSTSDAILSAQTSNAVVETITNSYATAVSGYICQNRFSAESGVLYCTPGIHIAESGDTLGQSYRTPEEAILKSRCDVVIVGRGITGAVNPAEAAKLYRRRAWDAHIQKVSKDF